MAGVPRNIIEPYAQAVKIYNDFKKRIDAKTVSAGDVYPYYVEYTKAFEDTVIVNILKELCSQVGLGCELQSTLGGGGFVLTIDNSIESPLVGDYQRQILAYIDIVDLYHECIKIFSNKIIPPRSGQKYAFQDKYYFGFLEMPVNCNDVITELSSHYLDTLTCSDVGTYYIIG